MNTLLKNKIFSSDAKIREELFNLPFILSGTLLGAPIYETKLDKVKKEHVSLIVVDGMAMLYRLELGDANKLGDDEKVKEVNREVAKQMRVLAEIARKQSIPIRFTLKRD